MTMRPYVVRQGDHLASLSARFGFDADEVWNDESNRELSERRNPQVLAPGDVLRIPETQASDHPVRPRTTNRFRAAMPRLRVSLQLRCGTEVLSNLAFVAETGAGEPQTGTSDGDGKVAITVPAHVRQVRVAIPDRGITTTLRLGEVDPEDTPSGVEARLTNLGYLFRRSAREGTGNGMSPRERDAELASAIEAFQRDRDLPPTGEVDAPTASALRDAHGS